LENEKWTQKEESPLYITSEHTGVPMYSHFLIFKEVKINNKYKICKKKFK